ncbi:hypothetical protein AB4212_51000, partial [Streptomyces sp. 2MCAF27]
MASWATFSCRCGHPRYRHGDPVFSGSCTDDCLCTAFGVPAPRPGYRDPELSAPKPDRTPHPACPLQDPGCLASLLTVQRREHPHHLARGCAHRVFGIVGQDLALVGHE